MNKSFVHKIANAIAGEPENKKTPVTDVGLRRFDDLPPMDAILKAWQDTGASPEWHRECKQAVRDVMPLLGRALDRA